MHLKDEKLVFKLSQAPDTVYIILKTAGRNVKAKNVGLLLGFIVCVHSSPKMQLVVCANIVISG